MSSTASSDAPMPVTCAVYFDPGTTGAQETRRVPGDGLTLAISHSTEQHLFIHDTTQSPFNVGTQVTLADFDMLQMAKLNDANDFHLESDEDILRFHTLVNGHPYLASKGFYEMQVRQWGFF